MSEVRFTVRLTPRGYRDVLLHLSALRLRFVVPLLAFFGFGALGAGFDTQAAVALGALFAALVTVWGYIRWNVSSPQATHLYDPVDYELGPEGIVCSAEDGRRIIPWQKVRKWRVAAGHYRLYVAGASYLLVPETDVPEDAVRTLEGLLRDHVGNGPMRRRFV